MSSSRPKWVSGFWIKQVTGWDGEKMKIVRRDNLIEWRMTEKGYEYNINSVPQAFIIKKQAV